jgi:putative salt-induced outer membrane protein YdiY
MNTKQRCRNRSAQALILALVCSLMPLRTFCAEPTLAPALAATPVLATNYVVVTNIVLVTNYVQIPSPAASITNHQSTFNFQLSTNSLLPDLNWVPPEDGFDWIQLRSGEWLKGQLKAMQQRQLEFDSEELNDLTFDWKDIRQVRSDRTLDLLFMDGRKMSGPVTVTPEEVAVGGEKPQVFPRDQLQSFTPGGSKELNYWSGMVSLGLTLRAGNTEQVEYNAQARLQRRTPATRFSLDYIGNISSFNGVENANNTRVNSEFDLWLSRRFYLILPQLEYYRDPFQNLKARVTAGGGAGYDLIDHPNLEWNISTGPAYQYAWFEPTQPGDPMEKGTAALVFGSRFDWDITQRIGLILEYRGQYTSREVGETTHHAVGTLSLELTKRFDLNVSLIWDRISNPKVGLDDVQPKPDDFRLVVGVGAHF